MIERAWEKRNSSLKRSLQCRDRTQWWDNALSHTSFVGNTKNKNNCSRSDFPWYIYWCWSYVMHLVLISITKISALKISEHDRQIDAPQPIYPSITLTKNRLLNYRRGWLHCHTKRCHLSWLKERFGYQKKVLNPWTPESPNIEEFASTQPAICGVASQPHHHTQLCSFQGLKIQWKKQTLFEISQGWLTSITDRKTCLGKNIFWSSGTLRKS